VVGTAPVAAAAAVAALFACFLDTPGIACAAAPIREGGFGKRIVEVLRSGEKSCGSAAQGTADFHCASGWFCAVLNPSLFKRMGATVGITGWRRMEAILRTSKKQ
jgi:hypothetical protein